MTDRTLEFFFDVASPYSYLAATQLPGLAQRTGVTVAWRPFLLGGVFQASGNTMPARVPAKARWMLSDLGLWAARYGVQFKMASHFPINALKPQRALVAAGRTGGNEAVERLALALFTGYWAEDVDVSKDSGLLACAAAAGLDGRALLADTADPEVKEALRAATEEAVQRGAFGAPTFFLGDTMFWGNDRLVLIEDQLSPRTR